MAHGSSEEQRSETPFSEQEERQRSEDHIQPPDPARSPFVRLAEATTLGVGGAIAIGGILVIAVILLAVILR